MNNIEKVLEFIKPYLEQDGIYLGKKIEMCDYTSSFGTRTITVSVDIASSFEKNESAKIKNYLRKNGFVNCGAGDFEYVIKS